eukprot:745999-Hanusia_phi.AAC.11
MHIQTSGGRCVCQGNGRQLSLLRASFYTHSYLAGLELLDLCHLGLAAFFAGALRVRSALAMVVRLPAGILWRYYGSLGSVTVGAFAASTFP